MNPEEQLERVFSYYPWLERVREYVLRHLDRPISLEEAADAASLTPKYFSAAFKEKTGISFSEWLHDVRIERARELLETQDLSITQVWRRVGYVSPRTFRRAFKKRTGSTPSDYKERVQPR